MELSLPLSRRLRDLTIGGSTLAWREDTGLAGLSTLTALRIVRRSNLQVRLCPDAALNPDPCSAEGKSRRAAGPCLS